MRLGVLARADPTGLGAQTQSFYDNLHPYRTLVVDMRRHGRITTIYPERFPDAWKVLRDDELTTVILREFLEDLTVVYTAETVYNPQLYALAREAGVKVVTHVNPEFYKPDCEDYDVIVLPTPWMAEKVPYTKILPTPVDRKRFPYTKRTRADRFGHLAGYRPVGDRNGTALLSQALRHITAPIEITVRSLTGLGVFRGRGPLKVHPKLGEVPAHEDLYADIDVLIAPRRYAGQAMAAQEALSCGVPVITLDREPDRSWGGVATVPSRLDRPSRPPRRYDAYSCSPRLLAQTIERLHRNPEEVERLSEEANVYAESISWDTLKPAWLDVLS